MAGNRAGATSTSDPRFVPRCLLLTFSVLCPVYDFISWRLSRGDGRVRRINQWIQNEHRGGEIKTD